MTATTSRIVRTSVNSTSRTDARTVSVRSERIFTSIPCGSDASSSGSSAFTRFATSIRLAPGWRCTFRMTAGCAPAQPASCAFSTPSSTLATSVSRTAAPFWYAMISGAYPAAFGS